MNARCLDHLSQHVAVNYVAARQEHVVDLDF